MIKLLEEIDELLTFLEDTAHGEEGKRITEMRYKILTELSNSHKQVVTQAEVSDGAKGAAVGQRSVGTNAEAGAFNCVSSESLVYNRPCKEWCGNTYCKSEAPSGGHL